MAEKPIKRKPVSSQSNQDSLSKVPSINSQSGDIDTITLDSSDARTKPARTRKSLGTRVAEAKEKLGRPFRKPKSHAEGAGAKSPSKFATAVRNLEGKVANKVWEHGIPDSAKDDEGLLPENAPRDFKSLGKKVKAAAMTQINDYHIKRAELKGQGSKVYVNEAT